MSLRSRTVRFLVPLLVAGTSGAHRADARAPSLLFTLRPTGVVSPWWPVTFEGPVALVGDLNGDGHAEILADRFLYSGREGALIRVYEDPVRCGAVDAMPDIDGDGIDEHVFADDGGSIGTYPLRSVVRVRSGATGAPLLDLTDEPAYGSRVRGLPDLTGDGRGDLVVGRPDEGTHGLHDNGRVDVRSGAGGGVVFSFSGRASSWNLGEALAPAGDVNGDGVVDLVVGGPGTYGVPGGVEVRSGADGAVLGALTTPGATKFGQSVAGLGDLDADGFDDFAVGELVKGRVHVYSGATVTLLRTLKSTVSSSWFGRHVASAGDLDGDHVPDVLVVSAELWDGPWNPVDSRVHTFSGATGAQLAQFVVAATHGDAFGAGKDVDRDGRPDFVLGGNPAFYPETVLVYSGG